MRIRRIREKIVELGLDGLLVASPENRRYLSGFTGSTGTVLILPDAKLLFVDFRYVEQARQEAKGFQVVLVSGKSTQMAALEKAKDLGVGRLGIESKHTTVKEFEDMRKDADEVELVLTEDVCEGVRVIKDEEELEFIRKAAEIADQTFSYILGVIRPGVSEREVAAQLEYKIKLLGGEGTSFASIVASGPRSALPHGTASDKIIDTGDLVVLDFGVRYKGYCSDMTRTVAVGDISPGLREIYDIVYEAQQFARNNIIPGMTGHDADRLARDLIESKGFGEQFGHGLGHSVGLLIHEEPRLGVNSEVVLESGMVVTVEPGIYLPGVGGVRIEDLCVIREDGLEILSTSPRELIVIK